jgi:hypothetical protein
MSAPNGHAQEDHAPVSGPPPAMLASGVLQVPAERIKELVAALEVPFDPSKIEWRVMNTTKGQQPARGQVVPYADQRAYTDRLNALFTPAGWTRKYTIHTSANFERSKDQKIAAKVLVTCELTIFGLGSHSATGEEWPMMIILARLRKHRLSSGVVPVLDSAGIFITSLGPGLTWTTGSGRSQFHNWLDGPLPQVGKKAFGPVARVSRSHQKEQLPETAVMASTTAVPVIAGTASSKRLSRWNTWWGNACIAAY